MGKRKALTFPEVAHRLAFQTKTVYNLLARGKLLGVMVRRFGTSMLTS